jgi:hypothetical protein
LESSENEWTFGQIMPIMMFLSPILAAVDKAADWEIENRRAGKIFL